jgi:REP element-mobilizing transposase RayT
MGKLAHKKGPTNCYFVTTNIQGRKPLFRNPECATRVVEAVYFLRNKGRFKLHAFVLMPDHLHLVLSPQGNLELSSIMHSLKSYTANILNQVLGKRGKIWQDGFYDYAIRDLRDMEEKVRYVWENPLRKGLVQSPEDYPFSSANVNCEFDPW